MIEYTCVLIKYEIANSHLDSPTHQICVIWQKMSSSLSNIPDWGRASFQKCKIKAYVKRLHAENSFL